MRHIKSKVTFSDGLNGSMLLPPFSSMLMISAMMERVNIRLHHTIPAGFSDGNHGLNDHAASQKIAKLFN